MKGGFMANAISQSGPTGVINASLVGVIEQVCKQSRSTNCTARHAVKGMSTNSSSASGLRKILEEVTASPSSAAGSSRDNRPGLQKDPGRVQKYDIRYFLHRR
jgi:hypothetical protein